MNSEQHVADRTRLARSRNQRTNCTMPNGAFKGTVLPPSRAGRVQFYAVMHDRRFHSSLRTKLVVRGVLFCIMPFSTFALHMDSTVDCAQAHCEKGSVARFAITWLNGLLPYLILCAILVTTYFNVSMRETHVLDNSQQPTAEEIRLLKNTAGQRSAHVFACS